MDRQEKRRLLNILLIVAFGVLLFVAASNLSQVWGAIRFVISLGWFLVLGFSFAFILNTPLRLIERGPLMRQLPARFQKLKRPLSLALSVLLAIGIVLLAVFLVIPELVNTFVVLGEQVGVFAEDARIWVQGVLEDTGGSLSDLQLPALDWVKIGDTVLDFLTRGAGSLVSDTVTMATSVISGVTNMVLGVIIAIYVLMQKERLSGQVKRVCYAYFPEKTTDRMITIGRMANKTFQSFITGQVLEAIILGCLCFLGMWIFGFAFAPMVSVLVGVLALIPIIGAFIGFAVGAFMILVKQGGLTALWFCVFFICLQQVEGNLIYPHVVGKRVMLPGLWVLSAAMLGGNLAGILGMLVSVPIASLLYALLKENVNRRNEAREIDIKEK